jgi:hypothetical protein
MKSKRLLCLYPKAWRQRYEAEYVILLEQLPLSGRVVFDIVRGALDAHLHPRRFYSLRRRRVGWVAVCLLFLLMALPQRPLASVHPDTRRRPAYQA